MKTPEEVVRETTGLELGEPLSASRLVLNWTLDALESGRVSEVETALGLLDVEKCTLLVAVAWLTSTLRIADTSSIRNEFFERVRCRIERDEPARAFGLLRGLGPSGAEGARWGHAMIVALTEGGRS